MKAPRNHGLRGAWICGNSYAVTIGSYSAYLDVGKFTRNAGRYIRTADADPRRQALALIPPLSAMRLAEKTQVFPIRKDVHVHGDPQN
jgi:hypothetical protein